jgi:hypothetical protein
MMGHLLGDHLHRVPVVYRHEQREKIAAEDGLKRHHGHTYLSRV